MSSSWSALHARLLRSVNRHPAFQRLRQRQPELRRFGDPAALLAALHDPGADPETKNRLLRALIADAAGTRDSQTSTELVILALWPGLDAIRGRLVRRVRAADLDADLLGRLSLAIRTCDLGRVSRVAATLLRNLERDLRRDLGRQAKTDAGRSPLDLTALADPYGTPVGQIARRACRELGPDGPLVVGVALLGLSQKEAAEALELTHDQARKRYRRAIDRLVSQSSSSDGFSQ